LRDGLQELRKHMAFAITEAILKKQIEEAPEFTQGDCSQCGDEEQLLIKSENEGETLHYVCKECFLRGC